MTGIAATRDALEEALDDMPRFPIVVTSQHVPPSLNMMFRNVTGKGRVKTQRYREWCAAAGWDANGKGQCMGPFKLVLTLSTHSRRSNADLDNRIKPVLDLLVTHKVIEDDNRCEAIHASWGPLPAGTAFRAEIWPVRA